MNIEEMKQALEALVEFTGWQSLAPPSVWDKAIAAIRVLEKAIAETDKQEPVGEVSGHDWSTGLLYRDLEPGTPLYTHPQPKKKEEALQQDNWQQYAKEGETAQDVIERERADCSALLELYKKLKQQL